MAAKTYDVRCGELAEHFLQDEPDLRDRAKELALHIQEAIEDWIAYARAEHDAQVQADVSF